MGRRNPSCSCILYLLLSSLSPCLLFQQLVVGMTLQVQQTALLNWKGTLGSSPALISWQQQVHPCNWTGIMCNHQSVAVTGISLSSAGLDGNLDGLTSPHSHFWTTSTSALFAYRFSKIVTFSFTPFQLSKWQHPIRNLQFNQPLRTQLAR